MFHYGQKHALANYKVLSGASLCFQTMKTVAIGISDCAIVFAYQAYGKGQYLLRNLHLKN